MTVIDFEKRYIEKVMFSVIGKASFVEMPPVLRSNSTRAPDPQPQNDVSAHRQRAIDHRVQQEVRQVQEALMPQELNPCLVIIFWIFKLAMLVTIVMILKHSFNMSEPPFKQPEKFNVQQVMVEVILLESKLSLVQGNYLSSRAALKTARTTANGIYCPPKLQAALDLQSGILHAADEKDFKTAFSYFFEAFEAYESVDDPKAVVALKYMLLSKIMLGEPGDVLALTMGKLAMKYAGIDVDAMKAIAAASWKRSLADFQEALEDFKTQLLDDSFLRNNLEMLYKDILKSSLCRIMEPYSRTKVPKADAEQLQEEFEQLNSKIEVLLRENKPMKITLTTNAKTFGWNLEQKSSVTSSGVSNEIPTCSAVMQSQAPQAKPTVAAVAAPLTASMLDDAEKKQG